MASGDDTPSKLRGLKPAWAPGQSGNPAGRPKGARSKLGEAFLADLYDDFLLHGRDAIERCRVQDPAAYVRMIAGLLPKQIGIETTNPLAGMSDEELDQRLREVDALLWPNGRPPAKGKGPH